MKKNLSRLLSLVLVLVMVLTAIPASAVNMIRDGEGDWWNWWVQPAPIGNITHPEQTLTAELEDGTTVTVIAREGVLPAKTRMTAQAITNIEAVQAAVDQTAGVSGTVLTAVDITFMNGNMEVQPNGSVKVQIASDALAGMDDLSVVHLDVDADELQGDEQAELIDNAQTNSEGVVFSARHFSVYAVVEGGTSATQFLTVYFRNADDTLINTQVVRMTKIDEMENPIFDPGVPSITSTQSFEGWADHTPFTEEDKGYSVAEINAYVKRTYNDNSASATLNYYAKVYEVRYVVYHDQAGAVLMTQAYHVPAGGGTANVKIEHTYVGFKSAQNFAGWITADKVVVPGIYPSFADDVEPIYQNGRSYDLNTDLDLYPFLNTGNWLVFDSYIKQDADSTTASYTAPRFVPEGQGTVAPANPTRTGYRFDGWYEGILDGDGNVIGFGAPFTFGSPINQETHVYAKWVPDETTYHIAIWQQLSTDVVDSNNMNNEYAYYEPTTVDIVLTAHTGSTVTLADVYKQLGNRNDSHTDYGEMGFYFVYNADRSDTDPVTVKGDGSTVLNVYYDRKIITISFYNSNNFSQNNLWSGSGYTNPMVGLYQAPLANWPVSPGTNYKWQFVDAEDGDTYGITFRDCYDIPDNKYTTEWNIYRVSGDTGSYHTAHWMCEDLSGNYVERITSELHQNVTQYYDHGKFLGFLAYGHNSQRNSTSTSNGFIAYSGSNNSMSYSNTGSDCYFYFIRRTYDFIYISNNEEIKVEQAVKYQQPISGFASYEPEEVPDGYYFECWCSDPACTVPFDFETTMPNNEVTVYAKWTMKRYRVVMDPTGGDSSIDPSEISFPGGKQGTTFRADYGELVREGALDNAIREGYTLLGWYLDPEFTEPFMFSMPMNDELADYIDYTYGQHLPGETQAQYEAKRTGTDPWNPDSPTYNDNDPDKYNVIGKITIYAHWREDPDGAIGINVRYDAVAKDGATGHFGNTTETIWNDPHIYADQARAYAQPASVPDNSELQFLYWEILDKNGEVVGKAYPGQLFDIEYAYAVEEELRAQAVYAEQNAPDSKYDKTEGTKKGAETRTVDDKYEIVTSFTAGEKYIITYNGRVMTDTEASDYGMPTSEQVTATLGSDGYYTFNSDVTHYSLTATTNGSGWAFKSENGGFLGIYQPNTTRYLAYMTSAQYWTATVNNGSVRLYIRSGNSNRYIYHDASNSRFNIQTNTGNTTNLTIYKLVENAITEGKTYEQTNDLVVGKKYVIAIDNHAVGNVPYDDNNHCIDGVTVGHDKSASPETVTVPYSVEQNSVLWLVESGNATDGYVFRNVASGKYLSLSDDVSDIWLELTDTPHAWTYDGTDLNNQCTLAGNAYTYNGTTYYYLYLSFSTEYNDFTTSSATGHNVKFYAPTTVTYTVTFMDGYNNTLIETQQVEDGQAATAPTPPDHTNEGFEFVGWDTDFSNVQSDLTVTAQYESATAQYTVTFRYMTSDGTWISDSQTVTRGEAAIPPATSYIESITPEGYAFGGWDKNFSHVTASMTVNAAYRTVVTTKYVINLRAVYGRANTTATTHINWFANNDLTAAATGGDVHIDENLEINQPVQIPTPATYTINGAKGGLGTGLVWEDHVFLGWARLETTGSDLEGTAHPELTEEDLYLKWDPDHGTDGGYQLMVAEDNLPAGSWVTAVAADEMRPYHDMYAVWATVFYVYHSADNTVEKIQTTKGNGTGSNVKEFFDITKYVRNAGNNTNGYLYGGYYTNYAGKSEGFDAKDPTLTYTTAVRLDAVSVATDNGGTAYTGANVKWSWSESYNVDDNAPDGMHIKPVAGATYFLKEVPANKYLQPYLHYGYNIGSGAITSAFLISDIDDLNYQETGFVIQSRDGRDQARIARAITFNSENTGATVKLNSNMLFGASGYLSYLQVIGGKADPILSAGNNVMQYWLTPDGLYVTGTTVRQYTGLDNVGNIQKSYEAYTAYSVSDE